MKRWMLTLAAAGLAAGLSLTASAQEKLKIGFVYCCPVGDLGWSYEHDEGRKAIEEALGDKVETTFVESVADGPDAERVIRQLAQGGNDLIFTTSFGFMNPTVKVAKRFPDVKFEHATGFKREDNVSTYSARFYEGRHVIGLIAGKMTKTNTVGYIASFPIPEVVRGINAAYLAAKSVNPDVSFKIVWVNTWFDPGKEADAARALIDQGADVLMQHTDSPAAMKVAEEKGIHAFGQASDVSRFGPNAQLTAIIDDWAPYYVARTKAALDGSWASEDTWGGIKSGMVAFAPYGPAVPEDVRKMADDARAAIAAGDLHPFTGPINKQDGTVWLKAGETAPDGDLLGMSFYVEGIEGSVPQ
ncbi:MAG: BMP family ABC transporter substrate-binding protein [Minwuia sp.]|uniref:BMP family ABC transporter substrate-binding protein n=1 Tax=Minwuia sp. TaxID=2493630 RepID=UPI003A8A7BF6